MLSRALGMDMVVHVVSTYDHAEGERLQLSVDAPRPFFETQTRKSC